MTSDMTIPALAAGSIVSALALILCHEVMRSSLYQRVGWPVRYTIGIFCGLLGAGLYSLLTGDWLLPIAVGVLFLPGGALVMALYGKHDLDKAHAKERAQAQAWRAELLREEHDAHD